MCVPYMIILYLFMLYKYRWSLNQYVCERLSISSKGHIT